MLKMVFHIFLKWTSAHTICTKTNYLRSEKTSQNIYGTKSKVTKYILVDEDIVIKSI